MTPPYYDDGRITLYCGDMRAIVGRLPTVDHVMTDPPYDPQTHARARRNAHDGPAAIEIGFADLDDTAAATLVNLRPRRWSIAFCALEMLGDYRRATGDAWVRAGVWDRPDGTPQITGDRPAQAAEGIAIWHHGKGKRWHGGGQRGMWRHNVVKGDARVHPTQKPESLMLDLVRLFTDPDELILDPFCGSGTTLVAAQRMGRRAIGIELNEEHCASVVARLGQQSFAFEEIVS